MNESFQRRLLESILVLACLNGTSQAVMIQTVAVGYPGNAPDPATGSQYGAVSYNYRIGTYDLTIAQYVDFLNAKASTADPYGLWNPTTMDPNVNFLETIYRSTTSPFVYTVRSGYSNRPVPDVSFFDTVRFANWLTNGQGNGDTETGTYTITFGGNNSGQVSIPSEAQRAAWATTGSVHWLLPSENEWYKAAYFDGRTGTYYAYPFQNNSPPTAGPPPGDTNSGNFNFKAFNWDGNGSRITDVGSYGQSTSPFGSFDMGGDLDQWNESAFSYPPGHDARGGDWLNPVSLAAASYPQISVNLAQGSDLVGFRLASVGAVPEPEGATLFMLGAVTALIWRARCRATVARSRR